ncbi:hypothetical protein H8959_004110 [Pygathrix nigripes]
MSCSVLTTQGLAHSPDSTVSGHSGQNLVPAAGTRLVKTVGVTGAANRGERWLSEFSSHIVWLMEVYVFYLGHRPPSPPVCPPAHADVTGPTQPRFLSPWPHLDVRGVSSAPTHGQWLASFQYFLWIMHMDDISSSVCCGAYR